MAGSWGAGSVGLQLLRGPAFSFLFKKRRAELFHAARGGCGLPTMVRGYLLALLLALRGSPGHAGEYCHGWAGGTQRWHHGFQCPERYDSPEAALCCGTCTLRYCCSAREARLDQGRCPGDQQQPSPRPPLPGKLPFLLQTGGKIRCAVLFASPGASLPWWHPKLFSSSDLQGYPQLGSRCWAQGSWKHCSPSAWRPVQGFLCRVCLACMGQSQSLTCTGKTQQLGALLKVFFCWSYS